MTDEHDPDAQAMHEDAAEHEHPVEAPVDDFSDSAATEETATTQESSGEGEDTTSSMPEGRSRSMFPLMAGILVILAAGGGVAYWQLGRSGSEAPSAIEQAMNAKATMPKIDAAPAAQTAPPAAPTEASSATASAASPAAASSDNVDALYKPTVDASGAAASAPATAAVPPTAAEIPASAPVPAAPASTADAEIVAPATAVAVVPPAPAPVVEPVASAMPSVTPSATRAESNEAIDRLSARMDDLQKSVTQAHQQLADLASQPSASQGSTMLEERLNKIEQDLAQLQSRKAPVKTAVHKEPAAKESSAVTKVAAAAPVKAVSHKKAKKPATHKAAARTEKTASKWVLRAATPSEAWVSADATSSELRHIQIGDTLPGVGKVTAIRQSSRGWEIEGSEATLR